MDGEALDYWIVPHTHWDREWYLTFQDFRWKLVKTIDEILETLNGDPSFPHFMLDGQTVVIDDYLKLRPERRDELARLIRDGRIAVGPWFVQPDDVLVSGEALVRNLELGLSRARELGGGMMVGHLPDSFGHPGSLPTVLRGFGIGTASLMRGPAGELDRVLFGWTAKDGSRVLVANLVDGYGNGADLPMESGAIEEGLVETRDRQSESLLPGLPVLVMDGFDHRSIDAALPGVLQAAGLTRTVRIGTLAGYFEMAVRCLEQSSADTGSTESALPEWRHELRSVFRSPINAGCISSRYWIKQEDQAISTLLEARAEPLAALASLFGAPYPRKEINLAWRYLLLNQAHDSICGCSIDAVHEDMRYRYAQSRGLAVNIVSDALDRLVASVPDRREAAGSSKREDSATLPAATTAAAGGGDLEIVVVNPGAARRTPLLSFEAADLPDHPLLEDESGNRYPAQVIAATGEPSLFFDERFKPSQIRFALGLVRHGEITSLRVQDARSSWESDSVLRVDLRLSDGRAPSTFDWDRWVETAKPLLRDPKLTAVHAVGRRSGMNRVLFQSPVPSFGMKRFFLRDASSTAAPTNLRAGKREIENDYFRLRVGREGNLDLLDKASGTLYHGLGRLVDCGDRGDEYNFDALTRDRVIARPSRRRASPCRLRSVRLVEAGPVRATLRIDRLYRLPESLSPDRNGRARRRVDVEVSMWASLSAATRRVELRVEVDNRARDHRLRLHFPLPGRCEESEAGGTFEIVRRPARPDDETGGSTVHGAPSDLMLEEPTATHPFTGFVGAPWRATEPTVARAERRETGSGGLALLARGLREYEILHTAGRSETALTLFRSVGWLSRGDLHVRNDQAGPDVPTPTAQEVGRHHVECAFTTYEGALADSDLPAQWEDYRSALEVRPLDRGAANTGAFGPTDSSPGEVEILQLEGEGLAISSLRRSPGGALSLRFYDLIGRERTAALRCGFPVARGRKTRLDGEHISDLQVSEHGSVIQLRIAPFEVCTIELVPLGEDTSAGNP